VGFDFEGVAVEIEEVGVVVGKGLLGVSGVVGVGSLRFHAQLSLLFIGKARANIIGNHGQQFGSSRLPLAHYKSYL